MIYRNKLYIHLLSDGATLHFVIDDVISAHPICSTRLPPFGAKNTDGCHDILILDSTGHVDIYTGRNRIAHINVATTSGLSQVSHHEIIIQ